jgi:hypothetical protein
MGELIPLLEKLREVLNEMVKVVDGRIEKSEGRRGKTIRSIGQSYGKCMGDWEN